MGLVAIGHDDARPGFGQQAACRSANPAGAAGHQDDLTPHIDGNAATAHRSVASRRGAPHFASPSIRSNGDPAAASLKAFLTFRLPGTRPCQPLDDACGVSISRTPPPQRIPPASLTPDTGPRHGIGLSPVQSGEVCLPFLMQIAQNVNMLHSNFHFAHFLACSTRILSSCTQKNANAMR